MSKREENHDGKQAGSLNVRMSVRFVPSKQVATPGDEGKGDNSLTT